MAVTAPKSKINKSSEAGNIATPAAVAPCSMGAEVVSLHVACASGVETEGALTLHSASAFSPELLVKVALPPLNRSSAAPFASIGLKGFVERCLQVASTSQLLQARLTKLANDGEATTQLSRQSCWLKRYSTVASASSFAEM